MSLHLTLWTMDSPVDRLSLATDDAGRLRGLCWGEESVRRAMRREYPQATLEAGTPVTDVIQPLNAYFSGDQAALAHVPWSLDGAAAGDGFQARVWRELARIPPGLTLSYGEMARRAGEPGAAQAAGVALNRNPIAIALPCHRVVGAANASGQWAMVGFGGGLERKTWLLRHEGALLI